ncbi:MAG: prepilin-type N-terminal cleavage/methylation domain-containing protein [Gemmatimonadaceae bacterium]
MRRISKGLRRGLTVLEVVVAMSILAVSLLGMSEYGRRYSRTNANTSVMNKAIDLASARVERVKAERNYTSMDTLAVTESNISGYAGFTRITYILHVTSSSVDYKTVTVKVTHGALTTPVKKTTAIARF